jgi:hypothetical protein
MCPRGLRHAASAQVATDNYSSPNILATAVAALRQVENKMIEGGI